MNKEFLNELIDSHKASKSFPSTFSVCKIIDELLGVLFPGQSKKHFRSSSEIEKTIDETHLELNTLLGSLNFCESNQVEKLTSRFFDEALPNIYEELKEDVLSLVDGDPAAVDKFEVVRSYPGFYAMGYYRIGHALLNLGVPYIPRIMTEYVHSKTGIDIHPGAKIAPGFFIDHGTGIVIGETAIIGRGVKIYQGVTLGALSVSKELASTKRHPTIEDNVVIYANATILGGETVIGANSIIGGSVWLTRSLPKESVVYHQAAVKIGENK